MAGVVALMSRPIDRLLRSTKSRDVCSGWDDGLRLLRPLITRQAKSLTKRAGPLEGMVLSQY